MRVDEHLSVGHLPLILQQRLDRVVVAGAWDDPAQDDEAMAIGRTFKQALNKAVRSLETAAAGGLLEPYAGDSRIFIYPGFEFRVIDGLVTNFHLPESTLLMLVSALAGRNRVLEAYRHAVEQRYRFFSYGDAMLIL